MPSLKFAINHMTTPDLALDAFFGLAARLGAEGVEIRNDLKGNAIADGTAAADVRKAAEAHGLRILSINALYPFNIWEGERAEQAKRLAGYAAECGAEGLVMVPLNDGTNREDGRRQERLREALSHLAPILKESGVTGLVEPLGFEICSLRLKREALDAIGAVDGGDVFRLVHDTFHHHLAGEAELFADRTGLVHISGVEDSALTPSQMLDEHRVLVGEKDLLDNVGQIRALREAGYTGFYSFEPFAASVHRSADIEADLKASIRAIEGAL